MIQTERELTVVLESGVVSADATPRNRAEVSYRSCRYVQPKYRCVEKGRGVCGVGYRSELFQIITLFPDGTFHVGLSRKLPL